MTAITCWGDSLTFGTGTSAPATESWPARLGSLLPGQLINDLGVPGDTSAQTRTLVEADVAHRNDIQIFWTGHNDALHAGVAANIAACVAAIAPNTNYLVLSTITRTYEPVGSGGSDEVIALNAALASAYGIRYVNVLDALVDSYNPFDALDVSAHALGLIPDSLRALADTIHLTDGAYALIAEMVAKVIFAQGWAVTTRVLTEVVPDASHPLNEVLVVYKESASPWSGRPRNVLLTAATAMKASYAAAGYYTGPKALLDIQADAAARALI